MISDLKLVKDRSLYNSEKWVKMIPWEPLWCSSVCSQY